MTIEEPATNESGPQGPVHMEEYSQPQQMGVIVDHVSASTRCRNAIGGNDKAGKTAKPKQQSLFCGSMLGHPNNKPLCSTWSIFQVTPRHKVASLEQQICSKVHQGVPKFQGIQRTGSRNSGYLVSPSRRMNCQDHKRTRYFGGTSENMFFPGTGHRTVMENTLAFLE